MPENLNDNKLVKFPENLPSNLSESISDDLNDSYTRLFLFGSEDDQIFPSSPTLQKPRSPPSSHPHLENRVGTWNKEKQSLFYCNEGCFREEY